MTREEARAVAPELAYLARCAVEQTVPDGERVGGIDLEVLFELAKAHMLTSVAAEALGSAGIHDERFEKEKAATMRRNILLDHYRGLVLGELEKRGIWYLPLKGAVLKDYYPSIAMRQMSDNDILFDPSKRKELRECMTALGFEVRQYGRGLHDVYVVPPSVDLEMHVALFSESATKEVAEYYSDVSRLLIKDEGNGFGYHLSAEDFYIYLVCHEYKHYINGGTGLRSLLDTFVYMRRFGDSLDMDHIEAEFNKLGVAEYANKSRDLALKLFSGEELDKAEAEELDFYISSGVYGRFDTLIEQQIELQGKDVKGRLRYFKRRVFLTKESRMRDHPFVYKHKILLPLFLPCFGIYRLIRAATVSRKRVAKELKIIKKK